MFKSVFNWSGGKDSSLALHRILQDDNYSIEHLLVSVNSSYNRVSMHGVREELVELQAESIGIPLTKLKLQDQPTMEDYNREMNLVMEDLKSKGVTHSIFGDIFLEDLRKYREDKLKSAGLIGHFPIWKRDTTELVHEFVDLGFKAKLVCVSNQLLDESFAGRDLDLELLKDLPKDVDPCGENGEFHSFVYDGPIFNKPIPISVGEKVFRVYENPGEGEKQVGFWFCDLIRSND